MLQMFRVLTLYAVNTAHKQPQRMYDGNRNVYGIDVWYGSVVHGEK